MVRSKSCAGLGEIAGSGSCCKAVVENLDLALDDVGDSWAKQLVNRDRLNLAHQHKSTEHTTRESTALIFARWLSPIKTCVPRYLFRLSSREAKLTGSPITV